MANATVRPCPMCGEEASPNGVIRRSSSPDLRWSDGSECLEAFYCNCMSCGMNNAGIAGGYRTQVEAIEHWNRRTPSPAFVAMKDALRRFIQYHESDFIQVSAKDGRTLAEQMHKMNAALALAESETK